METGNWLESFGSAPAATAGIREYLALNGDDYLGSLGLEIVSGGVTGEERREPAIVGKGLREWLAATDVQAGAGRGRSTA